MTSRIKAAEIIMQGEKAETYAGLAARMKLESLRVLANIGHEGESETFSDYAQSLANSADETLARVGRFGLFQSIVDEVMMSPDADPQTVVTAVKQLISDEPHDHESFYVANEAVGSLTGTGNMDAAIQASEIIGNAFRDHEDSDLAAQATDALANAETFRFQKNVNAAVSGGEDEEDQLLDIVQGILANSPSSSALGQIMDVAQRIENSTKLNLARRIYSLLAKTIASTDENDDMVGLVKGDLNALSCVWASSGSPLKSPARRPLAIRWTGVHIRAKSFSSNSGRLGAGPAWRNCQISEKIIALSRPRPGSRGRDFDDDEEALAGFLKAQDLPWVTVVGQDASSGMANANAERYGVETIPFMILVGRDGNVAAIHVRGQRLNDMLERIMADDAEQLTDLQDDEIVVVGDDDAAMELELEEVLSDSAPGAEAVDKTTTQAEPENGRDADRSDSGELERSHP